MYQFISPFISQLFGSASHCSGQTRVSRALLWFQNDIINFLAEFLVKLQKDYLWFVLSFVQFIRESKCNDCDAKL